MDDANGRLTLMFLSGSHLFGSNYPPTHSHPQSTSLVSTNECVSCLRLQQRTPNSAGTRLMSISTNKLQRIVLLVHFFVFCFLTLEHKRTRMERMELVFSTNAPKICKGFLRCRDAMWREKCSGKTFEIRIGKQKPTRLMCWQIHGDSNPTWYTVEISPVEFFFFTPFEGRLDVGLANMCFEDFVLLRATNGICLWICLDLKKLDLCPIFSERLIGYKRDAAIYQDQIRNLC